MMLILELMAQYTMRYMSTLEDIKHNEDNLHLMCSGYRVGNPVIVSGKGTFIIERPRPEQGVIQGYRVYGNPNVLSRDKLSPAPIDNDFLKIYERYKETNPIEISIHSRATMPLLSISLIIMNVL